MALALCSECGHAVSTNAAACPSCGMRVKAQFNPGKSLAGPAFACAFLIPIVGFILGLVSSSRSRNGGWKPSGLATAAIPVSVIMFLITWALISG